MGIFLNSMVQTKREQIIGCLYIIDPNPYLSIYLFRDFINNKKNYFFRSNDDWRKKKLFVSWEKQHPDAIIMFIFWQTDAIMLDIVKLVKSFHLHPLIKYRISHIWSLNLGGSGKIIAWIKTKTVPSNVN